MNFKRTVSIVTAMLIIITAVCLSPAYATETSVTEADTSESVFADTTAETASETEPSESSETESVSETNPSEAEEEPILEPIESVKLTVKGKTIKLRNKYALNAINALRNKKDVVTLKNDKSYTKKAYKRCTMLAVNYSRSQPLKEKMEMPTSDFIIAKGTYLSLYKKFKASKYAKDEDVNVCGIANLTVGAETFWVMLLDDVDDESIKKVTDYSKSAKNYSLSADFKASLLKGRKGLEFKDKTVRFKNNKKVSGKLLLKNYKDAVNSYFKLDNLDNNSPVEYKSKNEDIAKVTSFGNVIAKDCSAFKERGRYTPKKGDFILFHWYPGDGYLANHVGIVYKVTDKHLVTIEGNTGADDYRKSIVSKRTYKNYKRNSQIVGFVDISKYITREKAESMAKLAKKQLGKSGSNFYYHTKAWKEVMGSYEPANWCAIFCGWLMEQSDLDPFEIGRWSPSCTMWIRTCHERATAKIKAKIIGTDKSYSYNVTFKV